eukprot:TRINITY_DN3799_c0_g1_i1.p1 TRINITY_DN3799_c0_g1~~TRINITY_DN3799_c0_g1_i1.p1  ORF type:complete len:771 (-),score=212.05 TRINITY_DN3799_c0_g1_i1:119-2398(-)
MKAQQARQVQFVPTLFAVDVFSEGSAISQPGDLISDCQRRGAPLEGVATELRRLEAARHAELGELINAHYADLAAVSARLVGVAPALATLGEPVAALREALRELRERAAREVAAARALAERRCAARKRLEAVATLHEFATTLAGVSAVVDAPQRDGGVVQAPRACELEHAAHQTSVLAYLSEKTDFPLITTSRDRVWQLRKQLSRTLAAVFLAASRAQDADTLACVLRAFLALPASSKQKQQQQPKLRRPVTTFCREVVRPFMQKTVTMPLLERGVKGSSQGLAAILAGIVQWLEGPCRFVVSTARGVGEFPFLEGTCAELTAALSALPPIFAPGNSEVFHTNFSLATGLLASFETLCTTPAEVRKLRQDMAPLMSKWRLQVYLQSRTTEVAIMVERELAPNRLGLVGSPPPLPDNGFRCRATSAVLEAINYCWSEPVYIPELTPAFFRLTLQLAARYHRWLSDGVAAVVASTAAASSQDGKGASPKPEPTSAAGAAAAWTWAESTRAYVDSQRLASSLRGAVADAASARACAVYPQRTDGLSRALSAGLAHWSDALLAAAERLESALVTDAAAQCCAALKAVYGVMPSYRMTGRPVPDAASAYVTRVAPPLRELLAALRDADGGAECAARWAQGVMSAVADRFGDVCKELISTVFKTDDILKKMTKRGASPSIASASSSSPTPQLSQQPGGGSSSGASDTDKFLMQLYLDVEELGAQIDALGVPSFRSATFEPVKRLRACVAQGAALHKQYTAAKHET